MNRGFARQSSWAAGFGAWLAVAVAGLAAPAAAARDIEQVEAVGAAEILPGTPSGRTPRDRAVREALKDAVRKSASALVAIADDRDLGRLAAALGDDPYRFVSRFRVVEDRGVQPALFSSNPDVESEYRVIVEVHVDRDLIRERLVATEMLEAPSGIVPTFQTRIALEGLDDYRVYESIRSALVAGVGARSATPVEAMPGRIVIAVDSVLSGLELLSALELAIAPDLMLIPLQVDPESLRLRVSVREVGSFDPAGDLATPPHAELDPIDTTGRNRY